MVIKYYKHVNFEGLGKRLCEYVAQVAKTSDKRVTIKSVKIRPFDRNVKVSREFMKKLEQNEIGIGKNLRTCYDIEEP